MIHCRKKKQQQTKTTRPGFTEFLQVLLGLTCFYRTSLGVTWLNLILTVFYRVLPSSTGFLPSFTGFNLFLPDFPRFHLVKPGFIEFLPSFRKSVFHLVTRFRLSVLRGWDPFWTRRHFDEEMAVGFRFSFFLRSPIGRPVPRRPRVSFRYRDDRDDDDDDEDDDGRRWR